MSPFFRLTSHTGHDAHDASSGGASVCLHVDVPVFALKPSCERGTRTNEVFFFSPSYLCFATVFVACAQ